MVGYTESQKVASINKVFADSYKSPLSVIVVDNLERLLGDYSRMPYDCTSSDVVQIGHQLALDSPIRCYKLYWFSLPEDHQRYVQAVIERIQF
jgi:hypothetical protein